MLDYVRNENILNMKKEIKALLVEKGFEKGTFIYVYPKYINVVCKYQGIKVVYKTIDIKNININTDIEKLKEISGRGVVLNVANKILEIIKKVDATNTNL